MAAATASVSANEDVHCDEKASRGSMGVVVDAVVHDRPPDADADALRVLLDGRLVEEGVAYDGTCSCVLVVGTLHDS